jgi:hypothetical protein
MSNLLRPYHHPTYGGNAALPKGVLPLKKGLLLVVALEALLFALVRF